MIPAQLAYCRLKLPRWLRVMPEGQGEQNISDLSSILSRNFRNSIILFPNAVTVATNLKVYECENPKAGKKRISPFKRSQRAIQRNNTFEGEENT